MADGLNQVTAAGVKLDGQMHDLSAVAGVTGDGLKQIETFARESARHSAPMPAWPLRVTNLLSQLSPELGKYPEALHSMGDYAADHKQAWGGDGVASRRCPPRR